MNVKVLFFQVKDGVSPVKKFLDEIENKALKAKTLRTIKLLEDNGPLLREPYSKLIEDGIYELRVKQSSDIVRILYFFYVGRTAILTNGFVKKSQKTPKRTWCACRIFWRSSAPRSAPWRSRAKPPAPFCGCGMS